MIFFFMAVFHTPKDTMLTVKQINVHISCSRQWGQWKVFI